MAATAGKTDWASWLDAQLRERGWTRADLSRHANGKITSPQMSRWFNRTHGADTSAVRAVAHALEVPMLEAMVAAGHLSVEEADVNVIRVGIEADGLSNEELLAELGRRLDLLDSLWEARNRLMHGVDDPDKPVNIAARKRKEPRRFPNDPSDPSGPNG